MRFPCTEVAELVELVVVLLIVCVIWLAEQGAQRKMDSLPRVGQPLPADDLLDQIDVDLDFNLRPRRPTIPSADNMNRLYRHLSAKCAAPTGFYPRTRRCVAQVAAPEIRRHRDGS